jgi:hypothetical protein
MTTFMAQGPLDRKVRAQGKHAQLVVLEPKTAHARNRRNEARWDMLRWNGEWTNRWRVLERRDTIQADPRKGPFLLVTPEGDADDSKHSRWVHATEDKNFKVCPNVKVSGGAQGSASPSRQNLLFNRITKC